jgi:hypothetical protein
MPTVQLEAMAISSSPDVPVLGSVMRVFPEMRYDISAMALKRCGVTPSSISVHLPFAPEMQLNVTSGAGPRTPFSLLAWLASERVCAVAPVYGVIFIFLSNTQTTNAAFLHPKSP